MLRHACRMTEKTTLHAYVGYRNAQEALRQPTLKRLDQRTVGLAAGACER